jgi:hypothetical protein
MIYPRAKNRWLSLSLSTSFPSLQSSAVISRGRGYQYIATLHCGLLHGRLWLSNARTQIRGKAKHRMGGNISFTLDVTIIIVFALVSARCYLILFCCFPSVLFIPSFSNITIRIKKKLVTQIEKFLY